MNHSEIVSFIWGVADLIRDSFKRGKYQDVILPLTVLRRLDCVLAPNKEAVLRRQGELRARGLEDLYAQLCKASGFAVLQHVAVRLRQAPGRGPRPRGQPAELHRGLQPEHAGGAGALRLRQHHQQARRGGAAVPGAGALQVRRFAPGKGRQPDHGHRFRGADSQVQRSPGRESRRALHATRRRPPDGGSHARGRRSTHRPSGRCAHRLRSLLRLGRHADDCQGAHHGGAAAER